jgi:polysaccharide pyruvyl transferase WcaK-like protein/organic radical activating enzyme
VRIIKKIIKYTLRKFGYDIVRIQPSVSRLESINYQDISTLIQKVNPDVKNINMNGKKKVLFVSDNTDTANFGCRGTSQALMDIIISKGYIINDKIRRKELLSLFSATAVCNDFFQYISAVKQFDKTAYNTVLERINGSDILILNGEGSFIFQSPLRLDMLNALVLFCACIESGKPFFLLNAMFTYYAQGSPHEQPHNEELLKQCLSILEHSALVSARDMVSYDLIQRSGSNINLIYCPDALFSWFDFYATESNKLENLLINYQYCCTFDGITENIIDFNKKYILMSGNSLAAHFPEKAESSFLLLASRLREMSQLYGLQFYLIECCGGDRILRQVSKKLKIPFIPAETNLRLAGYILGKAECFISGRYHPSILASLGGTPCVFMGSNSHKTHSLQSVLGIPRDEQITFNALPDSDETELIVREAEKCLKKSRNEIKKISEKNSHFVNSAPFLRGTVIVEKLVVKTGTTCSLKCEKCGEFNPWLAKKGKSFSIGSQKLSGDIFRFAKSVGMINILHIAGGEPFIHGDLFLLLDYVSNIYNIKRIEVVSNGTIVPDEATLSLLASLKEKIIVLVSDYGASGIEQGKFINILKERGINHHVNKDMIWKDKSDVSPKNRKDLLGIANTCTAFRKRGYFSLIDGIVTAHCPTAGSLFYYLDLYEKYPDFIFNLHETSDLEILSKLEKLDKIEYTPACEYCVTSWEAADCPAGVQVQNARYQ